jgi:hypothetical protein
LQLIVIASIHQPSSKTFELFSKLNMMSQGKTCYTGTPAGMSTFFASIGMPIPGNTNPAEHVLDMINVDFAGHDARADLDAITEGWHQSAHAQVSQEDLKTIPIGQQLRLSDSQSKPSFISQVLTLLHRALIKSFRDVVAYWIRVVMYMGLAIMMGTVWLRLDSTQRNIQPFVTAIVSDAAHNILG